MRAAVPALTVDWGKHLIYLALGIPSQNTYITSLLIIVKQ